MIAIPDMFEQRHACRPAIEHFDRPRHSILPLQLLHDPDTHTLILQQNITKPQYQHTPSRRRVFDTKMSIFCSKMH
jgi:hypothetical protein